MRLDKLTTKFHEALSDAQSLALGRDHAYIEPVHVLLAMLKQEDGPKALLMRAGVQVQGLTMAAEAALGRLPQVTGQDQVQVGPELAKLLQAAEKESIKRGDAFIASELFLLAMTDNKGDMGRLAKEHGLTRIQLEMAIDALRGGLDVVPARPDLIDDHLLDRAGSLHRIDVQLQRCAFCGCLWLTCGTTPRMSLTRFP